MKTLTKLYEAAYDVNPSAYAQALLDRQAQLEARLDELDHILQKAERGAMGLTKDEAKTPEWKAAKVEREKVWKGYQAVNQELSKLRKADGYENINGKRVTKYKYKQ